jgi:integrase
MRVSVSPPVRRPRGPKGSGGVYQRRDRLWVGQVVRAGKKSVVYANTYEDAQDKLAVLIGGLTRPNQDLTVAAWAEDWWDTKEHRQEVRPTTLRGYRQILDDHILPAIGDRPLIGPWTGQEFDFVWRTRHLNFFPENRRLKPNTRYNIRSVLHQLFGYAVERGRLERNPVDHPLNKIKGRSMQPVDIEVSFDDAAQIVEAVRGSTVEAIVGLALYTGARQGELLALRWRDVYLEGSNPHVSFRSTVTRELDGSFGIGLPKTKRGLRPVPLNPDAVHLVGEMRRKVTGTPDEFAYVFCSPRRAPSAEFPHGRPYAASHVYHEYRRCLERAGLPRMRFHDLRHVAASLMLASGFEIPVVSRILGHSTPAITAIIYAHAVPGREREAVQALRFQRRGAGADERARLENG